MPFDTARGLLPKLLGSKHLRFEGLACHIGSLVLDPTPIGDAVALVAEFAVECARAGAELRTLDAGGGWPILYGHEDQPAAPYAAFGAAILSGIKRGGADKLGLEVMVEPGRSIVGDAGVLLSRVLYIKEQSGKRFAIVDAAMTELIRPALYKAHHAIVPVQEPAATSARVVTNVVGPVCESSDFLALDRDMPEVHEGDLIAVRGAGAYGAVMSSEYNARPRAAEVLVDGNDARTIRRRGTYEDLWRDEVL
jgi:diaminopimelate decarboxylase